MFQVFVELISHFAVGHTFCILEQAVVVKCGTELKEIWWIYWYHSSWGHDGKLYIDGHFIVHANIRWEFLLQFEKLGILHFY